mmetsp:Transcript_37747/g.61512  ORF Transcript_37747/g.61512 Transcript_37747/m.61512 type:complete len:105 (+) Transcript_37747:101-415(+)
MGTGRAGAQGKAKHQCNNTGPMVFWCPSIASAPQWACHGSGRRGGGDLPGSPELSSTEKDSPPLGFSGTCSAGESSAVFTRNVVVGQGFAYLHGRRMMPPKDNS